MFEVAFCQTCSHWHGYDYWHAGHRHYDYYGPYRPEVQFPKRRDDEIERDIRDSLFWDAWVDSRKVTVQVEDGVVTLSGAVRAPLEKKAAEDDAWDASGVVDVKNRLRIKR
ncbi:MAG: BON domain-containing protein [Chloroflexi bacterium]|nr:BON domain-containing protein [Chloroflexota bacterium]MDA8187792.1 BON domain-containing protein [Dehalococcoidales bacterium]